MPVLKLGRWPLTTNWKLENCRYVGMISPDSTISNHRLRWAVDGMRFTAPLLSKKFYIFSGGSHTHTLPQEGGKLRSRQWDENEEEGKWRWGEDDNDMKVLNQDAKRGTQKKRKRANTNTWNLARNGQPWKGKGKEKRRPTENGTRPAEEGEDRSAWTNLTRRKPTST